MVTPARIMQSEHRWQEITVPLANGSSAPVVAELSEDGIFGVHQSVTVPGRWTVTHIPTLFAITRTARTREVAWSFVSVLRTFPWDWSKSDLRYFAAQRIMLGPEQWEWIESIKD